MPSLYLEHFDEDKNREGFRLCIETIDEIHDMALECIISQKHAIFRRYNTKVKHRHFKIRDLVLRETEFSIAERRDGKLGANWKVPYKVVEVLTLGIYKLEDL